MYNIYLLLLILVGFVYLPTINGAFVHDTVISPCSPYHTFLQPVDHFEDEKEYVNHYFYQRFCLNNKFVTPGHTPQTIFLILGGENPLDPDLVNHLPFIDVANETQAMVVALEIRYYGESLPMPNLTTHHLRFLTTEQILEDIANFQIGLSNYLGLANSKWIVMGCSYGGTLATWYKMKYPNLATAVVASSAPLKAVTKFDSYDRKIRENLGPECSASLKRLFDHIEHEIMTNKNTSLKSLFKCNQEMDDRMFLYMISETLSYAVQYNSKQRAISNLCPKLEHDPELEIIDLLSIYVGFVNDLFTNQHMECEDYNIYNYAGAGPDVSGARQWTWQMCSEYGWFFVGSDSNTTLKSSLINVTWWEEEVCRILFGKPMSPFVDRINTRYSIDNIKQMSNILFTHGDFDPWMNLSVTDQCQLPSSNILIIPGESHCANWFSETARDSVELKNSRKQLGSFIKQYVQTTCNNEFCRRDGGVCLPEKYNDTMFLTECISANITCKDGIRTAIPIDEVLTSITGAHNELPVDGAPPGVPGSVFIHHQRRSKGVDPGSRPFIGHINQSDCSRTSPWTISTLSIIIPSVILLVQLL
ncbi:hypothetical protein SAMD00019534_038890, partial [Acytostelium subglobosum LB1]|uniref:hypothetical protein n=1 Tax=Acytostelium subglobosum LB1 TaxID=1410327 RepID=UPI000644B623